MATINDIVSGALKRVIPNSANAPSPEEAADALDALNDLMHALEFRGVHLNWSTAELSTTFPLADAHLQGVKALLGKRLCEDFGRAVSPQLAADAMRGFDALYKDFSILEDREDEPVWRSFQAVRRFGY